MKDLDYTLLTKTLDEPFASWLRDIAESTEPLAIDGDFNHQGIRNMEIFGTGTDAGPYPHAALERLLRSMFTLRQMQLRKTHPDTPFLFYAWHDYQAAQLRCSVIQSDNPDDLPFGCTVVPTSDLSRVVADALKDWDHLSWGNMENVESNAAGNEDDEEREFVLGVFVSSL